MNNQIAWAVQSNMVNQPDIERMRTAAQELGHNFYEYVAKPFCDVDTFEISHIPKDEKVLFYGSCQSIAKLSAKYRRSNEHRWIFYTGHQNNFNAMVYMKEYSRLCLNAENSEWTIFRGVCANMETRTVMALARNYEVDGEVFIRPSDGDKSFAGQIISLLELEPWIEQVCKGGLEAVSGDSWILVARPVKIDSEFRCWLVEGKIASISMYRSNGQIQRGQIYHDSPVYETLRVFCEIAHRLCDAGEVYCLDIGFVENKWGGLVPYVIENNCFHSSGWYQADVWRVMRSIEIHVDDRKGWRRP